MDRIIPDSQGWTVREPPKLRAVPDAPEHGGEWVRARTLPDEKGRSERVEGVLVLRWVQLTNSWRHSVNGRSVDPASVAVVSPPQ